MSRNTLEKSLVVMLAVMAGTLSMVAQDAAVVPRLIRVSGTLQGEPAGPRTLGVTFSIYSAADAASPLWVETQNVEVDEKGHYTASLGVASRAGVPFELFQTTEERWLGVRVEGHPESQRLLFVSVPYALRAEEAERLAGRRASEFVSVEQLRAEVQRQVEQRTVSSGQISGAASAAAPSSLTLGPTNFAGNTSDQIILVEQAGTGYALLATGTGALPAIQGRSPGPNGVGVRGDATSTSGSGIGVHGVSRSPGAAGVVGGTGVLGESISASGATFGIRGKVVSPNGFAVYGQGLSNTGPTYGVVGDVRSPSGVAGGFNSSGGGLILRGMNNWAEKFRVAASGDLFTAGSITGTQFFGDGSTLSGLVKTITPSSGIQVSGEASAPTIALDPAIIATLNTNVYTGAQTAPSFTASNAIVASTNLPVNGAFVVMPDSQDTVHSFTKQSGDQMHFRLSRATPDAGGGQHFLITPYNFGIAIEYAGVIETWSKDLSVHGYGPNTPNFWVDDDLDMGGLYMAGRQFAGTNGFVRIAADKFDHTSHGSFRFQVRNPEDQFWFQSGPWDQEQIMVQILKNQTPYIQANALQVRTPSVVTAIETDEQGLRGIVGTRTSHLFDIIVADQTANPAIRIFPNNNVSIGSTFDRGAKLAVGSVGGFQVADSGAVTIGTTGTPITRHVSATAVLAFGSIAQGACEVQNIAVPGAENGDTVNIGVPQQMAGIPGLMYFGWVGALNTVSIRVCNVAFGGNVAIPAGNVRADVWKH